MHFEKPTRVTRGEQWSARVRTVTATAYCYWEVGSGSYVRVICETKRNRKPVGSRN